MRLIGMLDTTYVRRVAIALEVLGLRFLFVALTVVLFSANLAAAAPSRAEALSIGETWTMYSAVLGETRRINVYIPLDSSPGKALPVMYMPDGGMREDFQHVAGLLQVGAGNGTTRPFLLVGIENTERRRDLTGPTDNAKDRSIAPRVGGSAAFRKFVGSELKPEIARRYAVTSESAIVGESLAGLFVVETLALEPGLFDTYIAIDPSMWWNNATLAKAFNATPPVMHGNKTLYIAASADALAGDGEADIRAGAAKSPGLKFLYQAWPDETHATIFHPAALKAFRATLKP